MSAEGMGTNPLWPATGRHLADATLVAAAAGATVGVAATFLMDPAGALQWFGFVILLLCAIAIVVAVAGTLSAFITTAIVTALVCTGICRAEATRWPTTGAYSALLVLLFAAPAIAALPAAGWLCLVPIAAAGAWLAWKLPRPATSARPAEPRSTSTAMRPSRRTRVAAGWLALGILLTAVTAVSLLTVGPSNPTAWRAISAALGIIPPTAYFLHLRRARRAPVTDIMPRA